MPPLNQDAVDALALYSATVRQLRISPFFRDPRIRQKWNPDDQGGHTLASVSLHHETVITEMVLPFRRIWMEEEPTNFHKIRAILGRDCPESRGHLKAYRDLFKKATGPIKSWPRQLATGYTGRDIIDLWFNTKYFHSEPSAKAGKFTIDDFTRAEMRMGEPIFRYFFHQSMHAVGICFTNLDNLVARVMHAWAREGHMPRVCTAPDAPSPLLDLATPGLVDQYNMPAAKLGRLCRKPRCNQIGWLLEQLGLKDDKAVDGVRESSSVTQIIEGAGFTLQHTDDFVVEKTCAISMLGDDSSVSLATGRFRDGFIIVCEDKTVMYGEDAIGILDTQLAALKQGLDDPDV